MRQCIVCKHDIPERRLQILPNATMCVKCKENSGDEPLIRRMDDSAKDGEIIVSTYYTKNSMFERNRGAIFPSSDPDMWSSERYKTIAVYDCLSTVFQED